MPDDKKKIAAMLVMGLKNKKPGAEMPPGKPMSDEPLADPMEGDDTEPSDDEAVAQEVMDALQAGDARGFAESLKSFVKMCQYSDEPEEPTEMPDEDM